MEATHRDPVWRSRADFIIATPIDPATTAVATEQLWARRVGERQFEICCIPFFAYNLALGDIVETTPEFMAERVIEQSGRYVFRVFLAEATPKETTTSALASLGALMEWSSPNLLAVDAHNEPLAKCIADYLQEQEDRSILAYETGRS
ncbi:DUF4265 domain-containing protein [Arthrobacter sp. NPDC056727]|uniref:DUF4265 domain-containing protein n=1 Tax=Arthrobacter sp. NPDC056727 TaxID=3345927 RepID=UPI00366ADDC6